jgi:hypothetical protein
VFMGDDIVLEAIGKGSIKAIMQVWGQLTHTTITQVLHVLKMTNNLISMSKLISKGFKVEFDKDGCKVNDAWRVIVVEAWRDKNFFFLMWFLVSEYNCSILWPWVFQFLFAFKLFPILSTMS